MRYVPISCLREKMVLAKNIIGANNELLLACDQKLTEKYINVIKKLGYQGVYIKDELSDDIEIENVIKDELRQKTVTTIKNVFIHAESGDIKSAEKSFDESRELVSDMVDEILENKQLMVNMVDLKIFNDYVFYHSVDVAVLAVVMGLAENFSYNGLYRLGMGGLLHDIGKIFISKDILDKAGKLTIDEMEIIKDHPVSGYEYLRKTCVLPDETYLSVLQHHERFDGTGYPYGVAGSRINKNSRIIAVADVYDAMVSDRPYRKALLPSDVVDYIDSTSGELFDPAVVKTFLTKIAPYPVGTTVELSNGEKGIVLENYMGFGKRPKLRIIIGNKDYKEVVLKDDEEYRNVRIVKVADQI